MLVADSRGHMCLLVRSSDMAKMNPIAADMAGGVFSRPVPKHESVQYMYMLKAVILCISVCVIKYLLRLCDDITI